MQHQLINAVESALHWHGPGKLGVELDRGNIGDTALVERMLTPNKLLNLVMRRSLSNPQFRAFQNGQELHPRAYLDGNVTRRGQSLSMVNMRRLGNLLKTGATVVLDQANVADPTMEVACRAMQWWSRERVQVNIYLTTNDAAGFDLHWDDHDVLVIQLSGEKKWEVRGASRKVPMYRDAARNDTPSQDVLWAGTMKTGDVMHIPRGYWHGATRSGFGTGHSLHMTLGFAQRTGVDWFSWMADGSREIEFFRHDLSHTSDHIEQHHEHNALLHAATQHLATRSAADYRTSREVETPPARHVPFVEDFSPLRDVVCVTEFAPQLTERGGTLELLAAGKKLTLAAKARPPLLPLLSGQPVNLDHASAVFGDVARRVAETLVREELCANLTPELSLGYTGLVTSAIL